LIKKIVEENDYGTFDSDFFNRLEEEEIQVLEETLENLEFYIDIGGPILIFLIPLMLCWCKQRLQQDRLARV